VLKPAYVGANGYRFYEEAQLLILQQVLFYRELGFELKEIKRILGRADFEKVAALQSHRTVLQGGLARTRVLIETIDKTVGHLKGIRTMKTEDMFVGFSVAAGKDRFDEGVRLGGEPNDCKVSARDTGGAMCVFEFSGSGSGPRHAHGAQDEWIYVLDGEFDFSVGTEQFRAGPGQSVFIPRGCEHAWAVAGDRPGRVIDTYQPAGTMEAFFREVGKYAREGRPPIHEALSIHDLRRLFVEHGMELRGPPMVGKWKVEEDGRITQMA
jgi:DNA-binding transcriptional MerR regulator/quercetin dioxygenase-like cupin family protein